MNKSMKEQLSSMFVNKLKNPNVKKYTKDIRGAWRFAVDGTNHYFKSKSNKQLNLESVDYYVRVILRHQSLINDYQNGR